MHRFYGIEARKNLEIFFSILDFSQSCDVRMGGGLDMIKLIWALLIVVMGVGGTGCVSFQDLSMEDVRNEEHFVKEGFIPMSIEKIDYCLKQYSYNCKNINMLSINPKNAKEAALVEYGIGLRQANPYVIIDFIEQDDRTTKYKGYTAISTRNSSIDYNINIILDCGQCKYD